MQVTITAVGPDHKGLADPIIHYVTGAGANIHEIQMYDRDSEQLFAMFMRIDWPGTSVPVATLRKHLEEIGQLRGLQIRVWSRDEHDRPPRLAICTTFRTEPPLAILRAIRDRRLKAEAAVMIGNRNACRSVADQFDVPFVNIGDSVGNPDYAKLAQVIDVQQIDYVVLARYMRVLPAELCWKFAGDGLSICITVCCLHFLVFGLMKMRSSTICYALVPPCISLSRSSMPETKFFFRVLSACCQEHRWLTSNASENRTMNRTALWKASAVLWIEKWSCIFTVWCENPSKTGLRLR